MHRIRLEAYAHISYVLKRVRCVSYVSKRMSSKTYEQCNTYMHLTLANSMHRIRLKTYEQHLISLNTYEMRLIRLNTYKQ